MIAGTPSVYRWLTEMHKTFRIIAIGVLASVRALPAQTDQLEVTPLPMSKPGYEYQSEKAYGLYDEAGVAAALPKQWRGVERLPHGFPPEVSDTIQLTSAIPDGEGGVKEIAGLPSPDQARVIKNQVSRGCQLAWYVLPGEVRYRHGPGLTGDEVLGDIKSGRFVEDSKHVTFIYGFYTQNVATYYQLYRLSGDPYYVDQIVKYAEGVEWILTCRS